MACSPLKMRTCKLMKAGNHNPVSLLQVVWVCISRGGRGLTGPLIPPAKQYRADSNVPDQAEPEIPVVILPAWITVQAIHLKGCVGSSKVDFPALAQLIA